MKILSKFLCLLLTIILVLGVSGCMSSIITNNESRLIEKTNEYLEKKYNEKFLFVSIMSENMAVPYSTLVFSPESNPDIKFNAYVDEEQFSDDYYGVLIQPEYNEMIKDIVGKEMKNIKLFSTFTAGYFDNEFTKDTSLLSALSLDKSQFFSNTYVFIDESNVDEKKFDDICTELKNKNLTLYIAFYKVQDSDFSYINESNYLNYIQENYDLNPVYKVTVK